ncbi:hypothetical protein ACFQ4M_19670 [Thauera mechernichensis]|uniref:Uncharacterized protein n=1 Tax=Thauera mechernichensis TaxID=82788 RepID=A0ABW3WIA9_9RHOO|nr:hypothetical protein [Thauera mechernichensis]MDG3066882.1 hypothetical protein [Thauera mechernichensis]
MVTVKIRRKGFKYLIIAVCMLAALAIEHFSSETLGHAISSLLAIGLMLALIAVERFTAFLDYTLLDSIIRPTLRIFRIDLQCTDS